jgi:thymidylate synthase (FAD)
MKVKLVSITPNPIESVYKAFRVCYSKDMYEDIKLPSEEDMIKFIKSKLKLAHLSPLEHVSVSFNIQGISRAAAQQLLRHRTGHPNMQSQRYVNAETFGYVKPESIAENEVANCLFEGHIMQTKKTYENLIKCGIKKEDARSILPNATTTQVMYTVDIRNFIHLIETRTSPGVQKEIKEIVTRMYKEVLPLVPFIEMENIS